MELFFKLKMELFHKVRLQHRSQEGYTFVEMLLVLLLVSTITSVSILQLEPLVDSKKIDHFFDQFENDILFAQQYAISHSESIKVIFYEGQPTYRIILNGFGEPLLERTYDKRFNINPTTLNSSVVFRGSGNIKNPGTMLVTYKERTFKVVFLLGKGRFYVTEL